jgi:hypothetical protein
MLISRNETDRGSWLRKTLSEVPAGWRLLDAGAGELRNRPHCAHLEYVSQDFCQYGGAAAPGAVQAGLHNPTWDTSRIDLVSDIAAIPAPGASFDAILCNEVLEHVQIRISPLTSSPGCSSPAGDSSSRPLSRRWSIRPRTTSVPDSPAIATSTISVAGASTSSSSRRTATGMTTCDRNSVGCPSWSASVATGPGRSLSSARSRCSATTVSDRGLRPRISDASAFTASPRRGSGVRGHERLVERRVEVREDGGYNPPRMSSPGDLNR